MKKTALTTICALAVTGIAFAQGNVNWTGPSAAFFTAQTNSTTYSPLQGGGATGDANAASGATGTAASGFYYELLYSSYSGTVATVSTISQLLTWSDSGLGAVNNSSVAGRVTAVNPSAGDAVPWSPGTIENILVVGWSANLGTTWASVVADLNSGNIGKSEFLGITSVGFTTTASTSTSPGATLFGSTATAYGTPINSLNTQLYELKAVPEPTTMALAGLGAGALLLFRRRK